MSPPRFRFIDLFAGIGGMRLGFERAGGRCVFTSEWDPYAQKTYALNHGDIPAGDITAIDEHAIPDHDVLVAGFPCQPFSIAGVSKANALGREHGFAHTTQGTLFFDVARIIAAKRPTAFLLENVKNLRTHDKGRTLRTILEVLRDELGYYVPDPQVIDAASVVPQHRERIYIVGFRNPTPSFRYPVLPKTRPRLASLLEPNVDPKYILTAHLWDYLQDYAEKHRAAGNGFGYQAVDPATNPDVITRTLSARYYKDGSEILIQRGDGRPRRLTPRECARLMGFPDSFQIPVSDTRAYKQFGNSVVVPVVEAIAREIVKWIQPKQLELAPPPAPTQNALLEEPEPYAVVS
ncbi:MAG: DNA (cytosine-5-)-methyltransferase [Dehalococcoidia bacterium]